MNKTETTSGSYIPGVGWRILRRVTQAIGLVMVATVPLLGAWQRLDRNNLGAWDGRGWELPKGIGERLPIGDWSDRAWQILSVSGGGSAAKAFDIYFADPVGGVVSLLHGSFSGKVLLAWLIPLAFALVGGRLFCGWFCPFGTIARALNSVLVRLPFQVPRFKLPEKRPLRFVILVGILFASALGMEGALYALLPHVLVQQSIFTLWLAKGSSATLGALFGLLLAGVFFGPTTYCATLCPTGGALSLVGRARRAVVTLDSPKACGAHCTLCDKACWLSLKPSSGDPGGDCDLCTRCFAVCPRANMKIGSRSTALHAVEEKREVIAQGHHPHPPHHKVAIIALMFMALAPAEGRASDVNTHKPALLLESFATHEGVDVGISVVDFTHVRLDADDTRSRGDVEISVHLARGQWGKADARGLLPRRDIYDGPLDIIVKNKKGDVLDTISFKAPNEPRSTQRRSIFRGQTRVGVGAGSVIEVSPIEGWLPEGTSWTIPAERPRFEASTALVWLLTGFFISAGLLSIALIVGHREDPHPSGQHA